MMLGSIFSTSQWFGTIEQFCAIMYASLRSKQRLDVSCSMLLLNICFRSILWMACVFTSKLQVKLSSQFYSWSSITREETFRKFYRNIPYLNPFCLLTSLNSEPWTWQRTGESHALKTIEFWQLKVICITSERTWRKSRVKNNRILTVESNLHNLRAHALQLT